MSVAAVVSEPLRTAFHPTPRGVVGLVDDLLDVCREHRLRLRIDAGRCVAWTPDGEVQADFEVPLPQSVLRAAAARLGVLLGGGASPYAGEGELPRDPNSNARLRVAYRNAPDRTRLDLAYAGEVDAASELTTSLSRSAI